MAVVFYLLTITGVKKSHKGVSVILYNAYFCIMKAASIYRFFSNKYVLSLLIFFIWLSFFDRNNLIMRYKMRIELNRLEQEKAYYLSQFENDKKAGDALINDPETIEKYAREKHLMKRDDEDIFLIVKKDE